MAKKLSTAMAKLLKAGAKDDNIAVLSESKMMDKGVICSTGVPVIDLAWSGALNGGIIPGIKMLVGDSRTFKTNFGLLDVKAYLTKYPDAVCIFGDSELGANTKYWDAFGIDMDRVIHVPLLNVEQMTKRISQLVDALDENDKCIIFIDSVSQLPSKKEAEDALGEKETQDMTRARALNSFWRVITPMVNVRHFPVVWINSYYDSIGDPYAEKNIKGGKQGFLSSDTVWYISRSQDKDKSTKELLGWVFKVNIMKGRFCKEKSVLPVTVHYDGGIDRWSGLLEIFRAAGIIDMVSNGWYQINETVTGIKGDKKRQKKDMDDDFWGMLLETPEVNDIVTDMFTLSAGNMTEGIDVSETD